MHRHEWYQQLHEKTPEIEREARAAAARLGLQNDRGPLALYSGMSSCPSPLAPDVLAAMMRANREEFTSVQSIANSIRSLIKDALPWQGSPFRIRSRTRRSGWNLGRASYVARHTRKDSPTD